MKTIRDYIEAQEAGSPKAARVAEIAAATNTPLDTDLVDFVKLVDVAVRANLVMELSEFQEASGE